MPPQYSPRVGGSLSATGVSTTSGGQTARASKSKWNYMRAPRRDLEVDEQVTGTVRTGGQSESLNNMRSCGDGNADRHRRIRKLGSVLSGDGESTTRFLSLVSDVTRSIREELGLADLPVIALSAGVVGGGARGGAHGGHG